MNPGDAGEDLAEVLIDQETLDRRVGELAAEIHAAHPDGDVVFVGVLKGAFMFMADLSRAMPAPVELDFMVVSTYGYGTKSSGVVRILKDLDLDITGRRVVVVEDIIDSGLTLSWLLRTLSARKPASLEVCALLRKREALEVDIDPEYLGFDIPNEFVVGYGLDFAERYRNLTVVGTLTEEALRAGGHRAGPQPG
jgi:hypoxanthine phosphoribosyltransferase